MPKTAVIQARIDPEVKDKAQNVLGKLHISMSEAITIFLTQVSLHQGIPFEIKIPNELTDKILEESEKGENLHKASSTDELFRGLDS